MTGRLVYKRTLFVWLLVLFVGCVEQTASRDQAWNGDASVASTAVDSDCLDACLEKGASRSDCESACQLSEYKPTPADKDESMQDKPSDGQDESDAAESEAVTDSDTRAVLTKRKTLHWMQRKRHSKRLAGKRIVLSVSTAQNKRTVPVQRRSKAVRIVSLVPNCNGVRRSAKRTTVSRVVAR